MTLLGTMLIAALGLSIGYAVAVWHKAWNDRPLTVWDGRTKRWRAASLVGLPWNRQRHGVRRIRPLERSNVVITLEQPVLEQLPEQVLDTSA